MSLELENVEEQTTPLSVSTDKLDYAPGETATFTASNIEAGGSVTFDVGHVVGEGADGIWGTVDDVVADDLLGTAAFTITDGGEGDLDSAANGQIVTSWSVNEDAANQDFVLTATDDSGATAATTFTDAVFVPAVVSGGTTDALFINGDTGTGSGTGIFPAFVQIQGDGESGGTDPDNDNDSTTEEGFNTDYRGGDPLVDSPVLDTDNSLVHNHSLLLNAVPIVTIDDVNYREFRLDINEQGSGRPITLDSLKIYWGTTGDSATLPPNLIFDLDATDDLSVGLSGWQSGSGKADYKVLIPEEYFLQAAEDGLTAESFIYLYSAFSDASSGFEEWSVGDATGGPAIQIDKVTSDGDQEGDGILVNEGAAITWVYTVTNEGNVALSDVTVTDDQIGQVYLSGDTDQDGIRDVGEFWAADGDTDEDGLLDTNETWTFTAPGIATEGSYSNIGTVTGTYLGEEVTDSDPSSYIGAGQGGGTPSITIVKDTVDLEDPAGEPGDGQTILAGEDIQWIYTVTNTGFGADDPADLNLDNIVITDDELGTIYDASGDGEPVFGDGVDFTGDDGDGILEIGEEWVFTKTGTAQVGDYDNIGTAIGHLASETEDPDATVSDNDESSYFGASPIIAIDKKTQDTTEDPDAGEALDDAGNIIVGHDIKWTYTVTNGGNVALSGVTVIDSSIGQVYLAGDVDLDGIHDLGEDWTAGGDTDNDGLLDTDETWTFEATGVATAGAYSNTATAEGSFTDDANHTKTVEGEDTSGYYGADPQIAIDKVTVVGLDPNGPTFGDNLDIVAGTDITWKYTVTNIGNIGISNVSVDDNVNGVNPAYHSGDTNNDQILDVGETWIFTASGQAIEGNYNNTGTVIGDFTDTAGHTDDVTDDDTSGYLGWKSTALTQGFWGSHTSAWDPDAAGTNQWQNLVSSEVLSSTDINPRADGGILLGDLNHNGVQDGTENTLLISYDVAKAALSSSSSGDAAVIMLHQAIAAQLNIWNGEDQPVDLITEAVNWLTDEGDWATISAVDLDKNGDGALDAGTTFNKNGSIKKLGGDTATTSSSSWTTYKDVDGALGSTQANGEGLKNALMWFNQGQLITSPDGSEVGWAEGGVVHHVQQNTIDKFWLVLGQEDLTGGGLPGIIG